MASSVEEIVKGAIVPAIVVLAFPDVAPQNTPRPYATYRDVGGEDASTLDGPADLANARMQVNIWADTRREARSLMQAAIVVLGAPPISAVPIGGPVSIYEDDTKLYGSRLDFSIWFAL